MTSNTVEPGLTSLPTDYMERVYAGVLGKIIGVYLGRPFEMWDYDAIMEHLGEINYYVHEKLNVPLVVTDDDITGTFTFLRALPDYGNTLDVTSEQIGHTWLNYLIEERTILWWGGMGNSTEHTAYMRLKNGINAPESGSMARNGKVVAEQIGAQIFIDGWAMVAPGNPELAADLAGRAAHVSHDGEAVYGAQVIAAMEAQAFIEKDINTLIDTAVALIPEQSTIYHMIEQIREWHATEPDWRKAREQLDANFGNHIYGGNCHMVPNHGLIIFSLLYGDDDFQKSLMVVNTSGWDTDCNSGNLGCLLGIKNGLAGIDAGPDWRGPIADRVYLPTADGGRAITDAVTETMHVVNIGRALAGKDAIAPKNGARFHFELPGSVQGFQVDQTVDSRDTATIENVPAYSQKGKRTLAIRYRRLATGRVARVTTPTFIPSKAIQNYFERRGYELLASPTLYTGQTLYATVTAGQDNVGPVDIRFIVQHYNETDELTPLASDPSTLSAGSDVQVIWQIPDTGGYPIASVGLEVSGNNGQSGTIYLDYLTWDGAPNIVLDRPYERTHTRLGRGDGPTMWKAAWVDGLDSGERLSGLDFWPEPYRLIQNQGRGLLMHGTRDWTDYEISARMTPHMCKAGGIAVRVQGMHRYYALLCDSEKTRLIRSLERQDTVLAEVDGGWTLGVSCELSLSVEGNKLVGSMNGEKIAEAIDSTSTLMGGGIALMAEEGRIGCDHVAVKPINQNGSMSR